jgi:hypothetical protein
MRIACLFAPLASVWTGLLLLKTTHCFSHSLPKKTFSGVKSKAVINNNSSGDDNSLDDVKDRLPPCDTLRVLAKHHRSSGIVTKKKTDTNDESISPSFYTRRSTLVSAAGTLLLWSTDPSIANCEEDVAGSSVTKATGNDLALDCLRDLPPFDPTTTVRLFLCRHGQTENNRLNLVQGARINASINETGQQQAILLGQALARATVPPEFILYSPLQRAQQTAVLAAKQRQPASVPTTIRTRQLDGLVEVDFGEEAEGAPVTNKRSELLALYSAWALGNLDARMAGGGESGREVRVTKFHAATVLWGSYCAFVHSFVSTPFHRTLTLLTKHTDVPAHSKRPADHGRGGSLRN